EQRGAQDVVDAWSPVPGVDLAEDADDVGRGQVVVVAVRGVEGRRRVLRRVEQHDLVGVLEGQPVEDVVDQVPFRIDHDQAAAGLDGGQADVQQLRGLARPGGAFDVGVVAEIGYRQGHGVSTDQGASQG